MQLDQYQVVVIGPNGPEFWPVSKLQGSLATPTDPAPVTDPVPAKKPIAGEPRIIAGTTENGTPVYECSINGVIGLIQVVSNLPDAFVPRGYNFNYKPFGTLKIGPETSNYGNDPLPGFTRPEGYRKRYFPDGRLYWEQSDLADEEDPTQTAPIVSAPATAAPAPVDTSTTPANFPDFGETVIRKMNSDVFDPLVSWKDGLAMVYNKVALVPGPGEQIYVSDTGQPPTIGFPAAYEYRPGTEVSILVYISTSPDVVPLDKRKKGQATIYFGNPPKTA
ncbi:hypothetical protein [Spirosoma sp. 48-14]|uniref:hypothetical protein n=1 Tax=Spirosoma sp. 48-14 TaxID=1895854 RepID=UPI00095DD38D|nr:hypothetical protein [Spirosoma sp. 48-14]OJW76325.1 MAG: hypothetical protein BGO59_22665 [Spirosoma sp. 48-14]